MSHDQLAKISLEASLDIFSSPLIKQTADELLNRMKPKIVGKIDEQTRCICQYFPSFDIHEDTVFEYFVTNFFEDVLAKAIILCLKGEHDYNMVACITSLLTEENLMEVASGECFFKAYSKAISELSE